MDLHNEIETMSNDHYVFRNDKQIHFLDNNMFRVCFIQYVVYFDLNVYSVIIVF
jgi:hypothetical protein